MAAIHPHNAQTSPRVVRGLDGTHTAAPTAPARTVVNVGEGYVARSANATVVAVPDAGTLLVQTTTGDPALIAEDDWYNQLWWDDWPHGAVSVRTTDVIDKPYTAITCVGSGYIEVIEA